MAVTGPVMPSYSGCWAVGVAAIDYYRRPTYTNSLNGLTCRTHHDDNRIRGSGPVSFNECLTMVFSAPMSGQRLQRALSVADGFAAAACLRGDAQAQVEAGGGTWLENQLFRSKIYMLGRVGGDIP